jgi:outer membrane protein assembly factor BamB
MKKTLKFSLFAVTLILSVSLCLQSIGAPANATPQKDEWPMFNHDLAHTGYSTSTAPTNNLTLWTFTTGGAVETSPAVVDGMVYFGSDDGYVYALNAANGDLIWNYSTGGPVQSSPAVVDGVVYVGGYHSHAVFALNAYTGELVWRSQTDSIYPNQISSTAVSDGLVYVNVNNVGGSGGKLYAFNASTGNLTWYYTPMPGAWLSSSPTVYAGKVYFETSAGVVVALDAASGKTSWVYIVRLDGSNSSSGSSYPSPCSLSVSDSLVYVGTSIQILQAIDASNGAFVWSGDISGGVGFSTPAVANGVVYVSTTIGGFVGSVHDGGVSALNAKTGVSLWNTTVGSIQRSSPAVANSVVFVGSDNTLNSNVKDGHSIYAFDASTGATIWTYTTGGDVYSSPAVAYGVVYVGSNDGKIYAIGTDQGAFPSPTPSVPELLLWIAPPLIIAITISLVTFKKRIVYSRVPE